MDEKTEEGGRRIRREGEWQRREGRRMRGGGMGERRRRGGGGGRGKEWERGRGMGAKCEGRRRVEEYKCRIEVST